MSDIQPPSTIKSAPSPESRNFDLERRFAPNPRYELPLEGKTSSIFITPQPIDRIHKEELDLFSDPRPMGDMFLSRNPSLSISHALKKLGLHTTELSESYYTWIRDIVYTTNVNGRPALFYYNGETNSSLYRGKDLAVDFANKDKKVQALPTYLKLIGGNMLETVYIHPDSKPNQEIVEKITFIGRDVVITNLYDSDFWENTKSLQFDESTLLPNNSEKYLARIIVENYQVELKKYLKIISFYQKNKQVFEDIQTSQKNLTDSEIYSIAKALAAPESAGDRELLVNFVEKLIFQFQKDKKTKIYPFEATEFNQSSISKRLKETGQTQLITDRNKLEKAISKRISFVVGVIAHTLQSRVQVIATPDAFQSAFGVWGHIDMSYYTTVNNKNETVLFYSHTKLVQENIEKVVSIYQEAGDEQKAVFFRNGVLEYQKMREAEMDGLRIKEQDSHTSLVLDMKYLGIEVIPAPLAFPLGTRYEFANASYANSLSLPDLSNPHKPRMVTLAVGVDPVLNKLFEDFMKKYDVDVQFILGTNITRKGGSIHCATQFAVGPGDYRSVFRANKPKEDKEFKP